jgi:CHASE3 domain sensor protein
VWQFVAAFVMGIIVAFLVVLSAYFYGQLITTRKYLNTAINRNEELNKQLVGYQDVATNALEREKVWLSQPVIAVIRDEQITVIANAVKAAFGRPN